jgi:type I restriction enzyme M protein
MADKKSFTKLISSTTDTSNNELEKKLWSAADGLRANSSLSAQEYSRPVLGLIFLKYADHRFLVVEKELAKKAESGRRKIGKDDYQAKGVMYLPDSIAINSKEKEC